MAKGILVIIEQRDGEIKAQSLQALSKASQLAADLAGSLSVIVIGNNLAEHVDNLKQYGPDTIYLAEDSELANYKNASYADAVNEAFKKADPQLVLLSATAMGKDLAPLVAAKTDCGILTDVTEISAANGGIVCKKPIYAGKCFANYKAKDKPLVISLRPNVFPDEKGTEKDSQVETLAVSLSGLDHKKISFIEPEQKELDVAEANIIVSGGRGLKEAENFNLIRKLAEKLGAAVGASRAVVDADWISHSHQVGQTGKTVSPNLYIAIGISGAIQHLAGMSSSKRIVAINKDPDAPIFKAADFGIVGDLFSVLKLIIEKI